MNSLSQSRLASVLIALVGAWLLISPLFISITGSALINVLAVGALFVVVGLVQLLWVNTLPGWVSAIASIWLFIAAFVFSASTLAAWNVALSAIVVFLLSVWDSLEITNVEHEHHVHA
jgi:hypothetical protein